MVSLVSISMNVPMVLMTVMLMLIVLTQPVASNVFARTVSLSVVTNVLTSMNALKDLITAVPMPSVKT